MPTRIRTSDHDVPTASSTETAPTECEIDSTDHEIDSTEHEIDSTDNRQTRGRTATEVYTGP